MRLESDQANLLDFKALNGEVEFPNFSYNGVEQNIDQAVGLVIVRVNQLGAIEVLLGLHNSPRNLYKHDRWGWLGETRDIEDDSGTFNTLYRLTAEELDRNLASFNFFVGQSSRLLYSVKLKEGNRSYAGEMLVVHTDEDLSGHISDYGEVKETEYEMLESLLSRSTKKPLREHTVSALQQLLDQGAFEVPAVPLRKLVMPKKV